MTSKKRYSREYVRPPFSGVDAGEKKEVPVSVRTNARQVRNSAGGWVYDVGLEEQLKRFLVLGARGTYYKASKEVVLDNLKVLDQWMDKMPAEKVVDLFVEMRPRVPKSSTLLACTAYCMRFGSVELKREIGANIGKICWTGDDLMRLVDFSKKFQRGWGRSYSRAIRNWYHSRDNIKLVKQMTKYQNRYNWSQRDVLKLASVYPLNAGMDAIFAYAVSRIRGGEERRANAMVKVDTALRNASDEDTRDAMMYIYAIEQMWEHLGKGEMDRAIVVGAHYEFPWELFPTEMLCEWELWEKHLLNVIGPRALLRQLNRLTNMGLGNRPATLRRVIEKFDDGKWCSGAHPASFAIALMQYAKGKSEDGKSFWTPIPAILKAVERGMLLSYGYAHCMLGDNPGNKRIVLAIDVSPSMSAPRAAVEGLGGLLAVDVAGLMGAILLSGEAAGSVIPMKFSSMVTRGIYGDREGITRINADNSTGVLEFVKMVRDDIGWGGTDCSLPISWALRSNTYVEAFIVITDNETWVGDHPDETLKRYRREVNPNAKMIVIAASPGSRTIGDPRDPKSMNCVGFDLATPQIIEAFVRGELE